MNLSPGETAPQGPQFDSEPDAAGRPNGRLNGRWIHSRSDPSREAQRIAGSASVLAADLVIVLGTGYGWLLAALPESQPVLAIDPLPGWPGGLVAARPDLAAVVERVGWLVPSQPEDLVFRLQDSGCRRPVLIINPAYEAAWPGLVALVRLGLDRFLNRLRVNSQTLQRFGGLWVRNLARNLHLLPGAAGAALAFGRFRGLPGLLVAGGPSLDDLGPHLVSLARRCLVVAVDTSLRFCQRWGVEPHFTVMVDPQYWNARHLDGCRTQGLRVVSESGVYPPALRRPGLRPFFAASLFPLGQALEAGRIDLGSLGAGGSVATTAWDFLRQTGVATIYVAGLDLGFPGGHTHFRGSLFEEAVHATATRQRPAEAQRFAYLQGPGLEPVAAEGGGSVLSDRRMELYAHWFEQQLRLHQDQPSRRLGSGGRLIPGLPLAELAEVLALGDREEISRRLSALDQDRVEALSRRPAEAKQVAANLGSLRQELVEMDQIAEAAVEVLDELLAMGERGGPAVAARRSLLLDQVSAFDEQILASGSRRVAGVLLEAEIQALVEAAPADSLAESLERSVTLYRAISRSCQSQIRLFERALVDLHQARAGSLR